MAQPGNAAILLVEDDDAVARMLRYSLRASGFEVDLARTGAEALARLENGRPRAVVLDLGLPDGLGGAVLHRLRELKARGNGPAWVVISAMDPRDASALLGPLGDHFLAKPFDPWKLVVLLEELTPPG